MALSDVHRNVLQMLLHEGAYSQDELLELCERCFDAHRRSAKQARIKWIPGNDEANKATLDKILTQDLNGHLDAIGLKVAKKHHRKQIHYGIVNLRDDEVGRTASDLSKKEQELFGRLVEEITNSEEKRLDAIRTQNLRIDLPSGGRLSTEEVETCLLRLEEDKWIERDGRDGSYVLGVRAELQRLYSRQGEADPNADPKAES